MSPARTSSTPYYTSLRYRAGAQVANLSTTGAASRRAPDAPCLNSSQAYFCR
ncbi:hypothetical protein DFH11DRAFT_1627126 [Phellopilus nigrolimitatus]|nr:hypothetical protein DFH11DRAFT_1635946 [Phellopilus nigrolimitatus]KAH8109592.1 hypothetical protein DFH11DRAFT_1627126 [Phellopilus nigrolimitatus]